MAKQQKIVRVAQNNLWQKNNLTSLLNQGWQIKSSTNQSQGWDFGKTCCCGACFLPLALLGRKPDVIEYVLEKEVDEQKEPDIKDDNKPVEQKEKKKGKLLNKLDDTLKKLGG